MKKLLFLSLFVLGCATSSAAVPQVRARAAYELDCPDRDIRVDEEMGGWFKAVGCGRKARYRAACDALSCVVHGEDEPSIPWRDRPEPGTLTR
jgi:hypothetical protein